MVNALYEANIEYGAKVCLVLHARTTMRGSITRLTFPVWK